MTQKQLTGSQVRQMFLDFFKSKGCMVEPGASLIPHDDPTLLWINAGVSALKKYFDGSVKAYLDWICVLKSARHKGVAQALMNEMRSRLKSEGIDTLIALTASNDEAQSFYKAVPDSSMHDTGIWIDIK